MQKYRCHKIVEAADLHDHRIEFTPGDENIVIRLPDETVDLPTDRVRGKSMEEIVDGYLVKYKDGYISWSPREAFEDGYAAIPPDAK